MADSNNDNSGSNSEISESHLSQSENSKEQRNLEQKLAAQHYDADLTKMLITGKVSNVVLRFPNSANETIAVHKVVICKSSPVFQRMFFTDMVEARTGKVIIKDIRPEIMRLLLRFLYKDRLEVGELMANAVELYKAADKYDIKGLMKLTELALLVKAQTATTEEAEELVNTANRYNLETLRKRTLVHTKKRLLAELKDTSLKDEHLLKVAALFDTVKGQKNKKPRLWDN